jgi:phage tail protein X
MPVKIEVFIYKGLEEIKRFAQPFGVAVDVAHNKGGVLSQAGLVHIAFPGIARAQHLLPRGGIAFYPDGNPSVHTAVTQGVQHTALFVFKSFFAVFFFALFQ